RLCSLSFPYTPLFRSQFGIAVGQQHDVVRRVLGFSPSVEHEGVIDGDEGHGDAALAEILCPLDVTGQVLRGAGGGEGAGYGRQQERKSTRLNSSHVII